MFNLFHKFVKDSNFPLSKLVAITTDGVPSMTSRSNGFLSLFIIHQEVLYTKVVKFDHVMKVVTRVVNYIRLSSTCHRLFWNILNISDTKYGDVILHSDIRWLSGAKALEQFCCLLDEMRDFLKSSPGPYYHELDDISWLLDLHFLADITPKLNELNLELQGKYRNILCRINVINVFVKKLKLWITHLNTFPLHFPNFNSILETVNDSESDLLCQTS
ncbi:general transcription factor II-I repeat domain-containing protein 2A-like [Lycorma delicatula]|uniref:general transcription factor II-I repeat domain-containing protein 2A-like n=1 Tax=Lycorma delicatula TaxID=130591 RepID=UPI003F5162C7